MFALLEFDIQYQPVKAVKGQALADLIVERINTNIAILPVRAWAMYFDRSACEDGCGIGILLVSPRGVTYSFSIRLPAPCTNNLAEYEAVRRGMELLFEARAKAVEVFGDSKLVISQLMEEYRCESESLFPLWMQCRELMTQFRYINFYWIPRSQNVVNFIKEHVIHRFGIPHTITTDGGSVFISEEFRKFTADVGIKLIRSSPYYAQANGQTEASNQRALSS
jgi:ribonuclease HI